ncbi:hypothetical protein PHYBLDRAFT_71496 [Phycomyces blakesleeanus NRRL 1555(-)]|uniref:Uncharacterized protein n=1 Tax=Phycomyces blakesleeanus (strain ATCC 8743b / DSM 1359 / FGSC 10004 / NBRC 33097 / NRRL 1555) TaxID=763407 RepID=A0A162XE20_PHYB8|nr:hypothetical protein PHYBLDRAFT_71496 [Phycomyces blakesleeanus NRRL 1555(-)]OAD74235.1 hypothetical protein PHYBLDRAFT_71496 [Phycomyces blakesleeanus NRRL 1555(-)]|eukprot:XP_018292275.1 hypothetical protein PHYBLDRAFT_71496 [Phycomyces blakesleeanus NRRL 1555(-)]
MYTTAIFCTMNLNINLIDFGFSHGSKEACACVKMSSCGHYNLVLAPDNTCNCSKNTSVIFPNGTCPNRLIIKCRTCHEKPKKPKAVIKKKYYAITTVEYI